MCPPAGIRAGKAAGFTLIAIRTTVKDPELRAADAGWVLNNCCEISVRKENQDLILVLASGPPRTV